MDKPLNITFLWHMHQPYYKNIETDKFILPWVRLHGVKDYYDMLSILDNYPKIKQNFNLVPSLLLQIEEYIGGVTDIFQDMSYKHPNDLNDDERVFVIFNFFMANWDTMVFPYERYTQLLKKRGENSHPDDIKKIHADFSEQEMRDLQVWFNLTWIDTEFDTMFPEIKEYRSRGKDFTEEEKKRVLDIHLEILKLIIPKYKAMQDAGRIEISTTPFYHPILPLVYNAKIAEVCMPKMPPLDFEFSHPEDAEAQIKKGVDYFTEKFGKAPVGMWPSEGSVSEDVLNLVAKNGIKWVATDQEILYKSIWQSGKEHEHNSIYRPHSFSTPSGKVGMVFRNLKLSDLIGFNYSNWNPKEAADHFIKELYQVKDSLPEGEQVVNIILDGENAWEYYHNDGKDFLNALYKNISENDDFNSVTVGEMIDKSGDVDEITKLWPGSWINHDFYIWIGHEDDRKSWKLLKKTREDLVEWQNGNGHEKEKLDKAWESIYIAEGSDWNWWYGDDHSSKNDDEFDNLYRLHLMNVYTITGREVPDELYVPISKAGSTFEVLPKRFISPEIDGNHTHFYEWRGAGCFDLTREGGAMHKTEKFINFLYYGYDKQNLYIRMDAEDGLEGETGIDFKIHFESGEYSGEIHYYSADAKVVADGINAEGIEAAMHSILEIKIPFESLNELSDNNEIKFTVLVEKNGEEIEKIPEKGFAKIPMMNEDFELYNWKV